MSSNTSTSSQNNKFSSSWILNWFTQFKYKKSSSEKRAPWKYKNNQPTAAVTTSEPIMITTRPSITISVVSDSRRSSQQTVASSFSSKRKFQWPHHHSPRDVDFYYRQRRSISSSTSRPNSILYTSQPSSPNFTALFTREEEDDDMDSYCLDETNKRERWRMNHDLTKLALDGLFSSPDMVTQLSFSTEKHILQVGCGNAAWSIEVALQYPKWVVIGLDDMNNELLLPRHTPKNFKFVECSNLLQGLKRIPSETFDLVSCRFLMFTLSVEEYRLVIKECLRILKPTSYLESMELDLRIYYQRLISMPTKTNKINQRIMEEVELNSLDPRLARRLGDLVEDERKRHEVKYISLPLGIWGGKLGVMFKDDLHSLIEIILNEQVQEVDKELDLNRAFMNLHLMTLRS
ncbi:hypothetical protein G6F62_011546 [Rhizopus arrhizus]|nr:hypothetical protein G6F23_007779 [Rhizopus arrhizus]KAG0770141.1 hypothetical protein G6F24_000492 [Rhizopus arrhizus]KAG0913098.1 hypothetical protein G6F33_005482 [Rhizopus arrhizus]KAG0944762.1 hypothetical protein G6F32_007228 [Rhizopus arrhizus]KAG1132455.1 hypothetical protein G6F42_002341 [Rhizopus arrhizus]